jgi:hypothetical protein
LPEEAYFFYLDVTTMGPCELVRLTGICAVQHKALNFHENYGTVIEVFFPEKTEVPT